MGKAEPPFMQHENHDKTHNDPLSNIYRGKGRMSNSRQSKVSAYLFNIMYMYNIKKKE